MYTGGACEDLHAVSLRLRVVQVSLVQEGFSRKTFLCSCLAFLADNESIMSGLSRIVRPDVHFVVQASLEQRLVKGRHFRAPVEWALREARLRPFSSSAPCWSTCGRSFRGEYVFSVVLDFNSRVQPWAFASLSGMAGQGFVRIPAICSICA